MSAGYKVSQEFAGVHNLLSSDDLLPSSNAYSYHHDSLGHTSLIDYLFIDLNHKRYSYIHCVQKKTSNFYFLA